MKNNQIPKKLQKISFPTNGSKILGKALENVNSNVELKTLWEVSNVNAIERLNMTDHGIVHFQIVTNIALKFARLLTKNNIELSVTKYYGLNKEYGELVIFMGSIMHDLGISINRSGHEEFSLIIANTLLHEILNFLPTKERTIVISETLHTIISHRKRGTPYTIEAGIIRVTDALDMTKGRTRVAHEAGNVDIHTISHSSIDEISISEGKDRPIRIDIKMNNSAGVFHIDGLLRGKLKGSGIEKYVEIVAHIERGSGKNLVNNFTIKI